MNFDDTTTFQMVKSLNVILGNVGDDTIRTYVVDHAFPRVKFRLLTATDTIGRNVFYGRVTDLADPTVQRAAEILLDQVLSTEVITNGVRQIVAKLACSLMTTQLAAQIDAQRDYAKLLEKQAIDDLENLIRSPILGGVVSAIRATVIDNHQEQTFSMGLDIKPSSHNVAKGTVDTESGATQAGNLWVYADGTKLDVPISVGDTPASILRRLSLQTVQKAGLRQVEVIALDRAYDPKTYPVQFVLNSETKTANVTAGVVEPKLQLRNSAGSLASFVGMSLVHYESGNLRPGVSGLVMGYGLDHSKLTATASPSIFVDIKNCNFILPVSTNGCRCSSDLLAFELGNKLSIESGQARFLEVAAVQSLQNKTLSLSKSSDSYVIIRKVITGTTVGSVLVSQQALTYLEPTDIVLGVYKKASGGTAASFKAFVTQAVTATVTVSTTAGKDKIKITAGKIENSPGADIDLVNKELEVNRLFPCYVVARKDGADAAVISIESMDDFKPQDVLLGYYTLATASDTPGGFVAALQGTLPVVTLTPFNVIPTTRLNTATATPTAMPNALKFKIYAGSVARGEIALPIDQGWTELDLAEKLIERLKKESNARNVLGVVMPCLKVKVGTAQSELYVPAVEFVAFTQDAETEVKYVFEITQLPEGVLSSVVSHSTFTAVEFNSSTDSIVISGIALDRTESALLDAGSSMGGAKAVQGNASTQMSDALYRIRRIIDTGQ